jgi:hypothetical protein
MNVNGISPQTQLINRVPRQTKAVGFKSLVKIPLGTNNLRKVQIASNFIANYADLHTPGIKVFGKDLFGKDVVYFNKKIIDSTGKKLEIPPPFRDYMGKKISDPEMIYELGQKIPQSHVPYVFTHFALPTPLDDLILKQTLGHSKIKYDSYSGAHKTIEELKHWKDVESYFSKPN